MIIDTLISNLGDSMVQFYHSNSGNLIFYILIGITTVLQLILISQSFGIVKQIFLSQFSFNILKYFNLFFTITILGMLVAIATQIHIDSQYFTDLLTIITTMSYLQTMSNMIFLSFRFFKWFTENRTANVFFYLMWSVFMSATILFQLLINDVVLLYDKAKVIPSSSIATWPDFTGIKDVISNTYAYLDIITFALLWISTVTLLIRFSSRIGKINYWILSSLPLIYYLVYNIDSYELLPIDSYTSDLLFTINSTWGGILFAIVFLSIRRSINEKIRLRYFLLILSSGIIMLFTANQATSMGTAFPPYGIITVSFTGISSFLIFIGTMSSVMTLANNAVIRREIGKIINDDLRLLDELSMSEILKHQESNMMSAIKKKESILEDKSSMEIDLSDEDIKKYIQEVIVDEKKKIRENEFS